MCLGVSRGRDVLQEGVWGLGFFVAFFPVFWFYSWVFFFFP